MNKFKNIIFHILGISTLVLGIYLSWILSYKVLIPQAKNHVAEHILMFIFFLIIWNIITILLVGTVSLNRKKSIFNYPLHFMDFVNYKWVYHSELGYFLMIVKTNNIKIYKQDFYIIKNVGSIETGGDIETISNRIKERLDWLYEDQLRVSRKLAIEKAKRSEIMKWDGYLDKISRRDKKIKDILK